MTSEGNASAGLTERDLFLSALDQPQIQRAAFLKSQCAGNESLLRRVEALLREQEEIGDFLDTPAVGSQPNPANGAAVAGQTPKLAFPSEQPGEKIGRYKLLQPLGEGGCGVVYMAEQEEPVRRRVALKIIKLGMDTKSVIARFEAERQALAMMEHANIAKVLDAGATEGGRPFFVMELVRGIRITEYCDENKLSTNERLQLFVQVCQAIQHAHQKGIIHRDVKPSNILVTLHDGVPVPKVIDFGIAKATEQRLTDKTLFTEFAAMIGTPAYMSPEQAEMSGLDIDTRSDIYSLGVLLYQLLTGKTPFDPEALLSAGVEECRRTIREVEPLPPSTRLATMVDPELTRTATQRHVEPPKLIHIVRGDLDWIAMKCLEKDRTRRYATANDLVSDIQRYLAGEPVLARPPSTAYRVGKFVRRNKALVISSSAVAAVLVLGALVSGWQAMRAIRAEREQVLFREAAEEAQKREAQQRANAEADKLEALRRGYNSDMNLVQQALAANNYGRAVALLDRNRPRPGAPDFRQWEWRYFWSQARSEAAFALPQQSNTVWTVAISPNGRLLASSDRNRILLWDLTRKTQVASIRDSVSMMSTLTFSPEGAHLAFVSSERRRRSGSVIKIYSVATRQFTAELAADAGVETIGFSPDGTQILALSQDGAIANWDIAKQEVTKRESVATLEPGYRMAARFSPDATLVAIADENGRIQLVDVTTGAQRSSFKPFDSNIASLAFSPDGEVLAVSAWFTATSNAVKLFSTATGEELGQLTGHVSWVPSVAFSPNGRRLVTAGADQSVRVWDASTRQEIATMRGHLSEVFCVAIAPDGKTVVSGSKDGTILGWHTDQIRPKQPFKVLPVVASQIEFLPDSSSLISVNADGSVSAWDAMNNREIEKLTVLGTNVSRVLVSPDGSRVVASTRAGAIKILDWPTRLVMTNLPDMGRHAVPLGFLDEGRTLVASGGSVGVRTWDTRTWTQQSVWNASEGGRFHSRFALSPDGQYVLVPNRSGGIDFRDLSTGQTSASLSGHMLFVTGIAYSPDGKLLATASADGSVNLYDTAENEFLDVLRGHLLGVHSVAFSPDGARLASGSHGNEAVKLWDVATRHDVATLAGEGSLFENIQFSPDGQLLVALNSEGRVHIWRAPPLTDAVNIQPPGLPLPSL